MKRSKKQLLAAANQFRDANKNPRTFENGETVLVSERDWTSGFFPGSLWYMYELTENEQLRTEAERFTAFVEKAQYRTNTHDLGFILYCSYGNGYRITGNEAYKTVMLTGANSLIKRYNVKIGLIKSWDPFVGPWEFPVIIDNMMNLELLFEVGKLTNNKDMKNTCISHANKTLENHFRADNSCFHVVEYDSITGKVLKKQTHQGYSDNSSWARGQAWALYGFTMMYRETKKAEYLKQAQGVATFILSHPHLPEDKIPYWDFDAPNIPNEPRDASAAAVVASALLELSTFVNNKPEYFKTAETILKNLSSDKYLAGKDENGLFILKHSTGNWPEKREMDAPLSYADYYFVEALKRYHDLKMN
ncbi:MAG: glycoside hydrolase family 88 protein [Bacteroidales bacterium]|nr:glycoside hydrolase family 88 protein [Bacteroidales bacterium]